MFPYSSHTDTQQLWWEIEDMEWEDVCPRISSDTHNRDVSNTAECSNDKRTDFSDIADCSFHDSESLLANIPTDQLIQLGGGEPDFNIKPLSEKAIKSMGVRDVNYELTFSEKILTDNNKMVDAKNVLRRAFEEMLNEVKEHLHPKDIIRGVIYNEHLDLPIYIPCQKSENMNADVIMANVSSVLNSNEDIPLDSSCRIVLGAIKYPRGGKGHNYTSLSEKISKKKSIARIKNTDNTCLVRAVLVSLTSLCQTSNTEMSKLRREYPALNESELLLRFRKCSVTYYIQVRRNYNREKDALTYRVCRGFNISG